MKHIIATLFLLTMLFSCRKESITSGSSNPDYFIFGTAYGMCQGNCANFFNLKFGKIYPDNMNYMQQTLTFQTVQLSNADYLLAKQLVDSFPAYLINNPDEIFGSPDSHDQGLIYIERKKSGHKNYWYIDTEIDSLPIEIRNYSLSVLNIVAQL